MTAKKTEYTFNCRGCGKKQIRPTPGPWRFCSRPCRISTWLKDNKKYLSEYNKEYRAKRAAKDPNWLRGGKKAAMLHIWLVELKSKPCVDCKNSYPFECMDFDHVKGVKKHDVCFMTTRRYSKEMIQEEIDKCELVCSNCHRIRTRKRRLGNTNVKTKKLPNVKSWQYGSGEYTQRGT